MKRSLKWIVAGIALLIVLGGVFTMWIANDSSDERSPESFIRSELLLPDGLIRTNITDRKEEYLAESMGLWMLYLLQSDDPDLFAEQVHTLRTYFLTDDHLVSWRIVGEKKAPANALIDDIRVIQALYTAARLWDQPAYKELADDMSEAIARHQTKDDILTDFVETGNKKSGTDLTLSYIVPQALDLMTDGGKLPDPVYQKMRSILLDAPLSPTGLFPKRYDIQSSRYVYDTEVNMIDQFYVGYHRAIWNGDVAELVSYTKQAFEKGNGKLYGRYDSATGEPAVSYESASVYSLAVLMCLEVDEKTLANDLLDRMEQLAVQDPSSSYFGGYIDRETKETHSFDNLLALIAQQRAKR